MVCVRKRTFAHRYEFNDDSSSKKFVSSGAFAFEREMSGNVQIDRDQAIIVAAGVVALLLALILTLVGAPLQLAPVGVPLLVLALALWAYAWWLFYSAIRLAFFKNTWTPRSDDPRESKKDTHLERLTFFNVLELLALSFAAMTIAAYAIAMIDAGAIVDGRLPSRELVPNAGAPGVNHFRALWICTYATTMLIPGVGYGNYQVDTFGSELWAFAAVATYVIFGWGVFGMVPSIVLDRRDRARAERKSAVVGTASAYYA